MADIDVEVKGLIELQRKTTRIIRDLKGEPMLEAMRDGTLMVQRGARKNLTAYKSPDVGGVDTGVTRASVLPSVRMEGEAVVGVVGSNRMSAVIQETGSRPHWPPLASVEGWARRHNTSAYIVARAIARRGNVARKFLTRAFEAVQDDITRRIQQALSKILEDK